MRILALDAALARCSAGIVVDGVLAAVREVAGDRGQAAALPPMAQAVLDEAGLDAGGLDAVAVTVGPGSFTGIRAALGLAHGIALGAGVALVAVSVGEVLALQLPALGGRALWCVIARSGERVFLERDGAVVAVALDLLPVPAGRVALAGDAAATVAAVLAARGADVMLTDARIPRPRHVAGAAALRLAGRLAPRAPLPLYVDPPQTTRPAGGLRPAPA